MGLILTILILAVIIFIVLFTALKLVLWKTSVDLEQSTLPTDEESDNEFNGKISVLNYNVFWRPKLLHIGREEYMRQRSELLLQNIKNYDIIQLEEAFMFGSSIGQNFVEAAQKCGFKYIINSRTPNFFNRFVIDSGLLLLSKFPIVETDVDTYKDACGWDAFMAKAVIYAKIKLNSDLFVHVFGTHLQASYGSDSTPKDIEIRHSQMAQVVNLMKSKVSDGYPVILLGDLNVNSRKGTEYSLIMQQIQLDGYELSDVLHQQYGEHPITYGDHVNGVPNDDVLTVENERTVEHSLDYILLYTPQNADIKIKHSAAVQKMHIKQHIFKQLSDHYAVEATIEFEN